MKEKGNISCVKKTIIIIETARKTPADEVVRGYITDTIYSRTRLI